MTVHKFFRKLKSAAQYKLCTGKRVDNVEKGLSYFWRNVTCKKCRKLGGK